MGVSRGHAHSSLRGLSDVRRSGDYKDSQLFSFLLRRIRRIMCMGWQGGRGGGGACEEFTWSTGEFGELLLISLSSRDEQNPLEKKKNSISRFQYSVPC
ncbi:hypothetical protein CEXT_499921 [Caerostris extrusa]|uniref:Uncharacterized protein n=1 Tax=Caerostris extrusa TaxID=172846 RepID=A0AAV4U2P8_CAEEX|nr:hypothetical protein CEXT_499921 [Caerostris extrusa]